MESIYNKLLFISKLNNLNENLKKSESVMIKVNNDCKDNDNKLIKVFKFSVECNAFDVNEDKQRQCYKQLKCFWPKCRYSVKRQYDLNKHILHHLNKRQFVCDECNKQFHFKSTLLHHKRYVHSTDRPFVCNRINCNKRFKLMKSLNLHKKRHSLVKSFGCDKCDKRFIFKRDLFIHKDVHNNRPFVCPQSYCDKAFKRKGDLNNHIRKQHLDKRFKCDECDQSFGTEYSLRSHKTIHSKSLKFQCDEANCGKKFRKKVFLRNHKIRVNKKLDDINVFIIIVIKLSSLLVILKNIFVTNIQLKDHLKFNFENCNHSTKSANNLNKHKKKVHLQNMKLF